MHLFPSLELSQAFQYLSVTKLPNLKPQENTILTQKIWYLINKTQFLMAQSVGSPTQSIFQCQCNSLYRSGNEPRDRPLAVSKVNQMT